MCSGTPGHWTGSWARQDMGIDMSKTLTSFTLK